MHQSNDFMTFDRIFIPIWHDSHYCDVVIDFCNQKILYLDNRKYGKSPEKSVFWELAIILREQFTIFLQEMNHPKVNEFMSYQMENVSFEW